ncbi:MAG: ABC transporter ATP-binding protein [Alphaproteobacteria bacterium]|nr:ABC transporter ATP-binding protein [Alphaproteobacteria bacterium]
MAMASAVRAEGARHPILEVRDATHRFGDVLALDRVSITAAQGEFLTILGESGSGKTTLLRIVSGLEKPSELESLRIAGQDVARVPASDRNCTTVFQHYALFPHMSVGENVEYGLKVRGVALVERRRRATEALALVRLGDKFDRRVHQLSGGERQRVALARALVTRPAILLLDEPLGALDEKLRQDMQVELLDLHRKLGLTFVYITHSQEEALTMSDRIILMRRGRIVQEGTPANIFERPATRFVADFMGMENLIPARFEGLEDGFAVARVGAHRVRGNWCGVEQAASGDQVHVGVRAERVRFAVSGDEGHPNQITCRQGQTVYKGKYVDQGAETELGTISARIWDHGLDPARITHLWWRTEDCVIVPD